MENSIISWEKFLLENGDVEFVWLRFMSYTSNALVRIIPRLKFTRMLKEGKLLSMTKAVLHVLPGDLLAEGASPTGTLYLRPDLSTVHCQAMSNGARAVVSVDCVDKTGTPIAECARSKLQDLHHSLQQETGCTLLVGFEVEVMFLRPKKQEGTIVDYEAVNTQHGFTSMTPEDYDYLYLIEAVARALSEVGIALEQFHAEAAPGQWEFVLPPCQPVQAVEMMLRARETIMIVAQSFGFRATVSTQPIPEKACNGAHVHISVNTLDEKDKSVCSDHLVQQAESFFAGIMRHLPAILAFSLPNDFSYGRIATGIWSGGEYAAWGWENKEVALRRVQKNWFEVKLMDGLANPYLALCALLGAGIDGIRAKLPLTGGNCPKAAASMSVEEREALGIKDTLPTMLDYSLAALQQDTQLQELMGPIMVSSYLSLKRGEAQIFRAIPEDQRRNWLIARY